MSNQESQLIPGPVKLPRKPEGPIKEGADIIWQVYESSFPDLPNLFEAVPKLIGDINSALADPSVSEDEKWLFREKDGKPPMISFIVFKDKEGNTVCLTYDTAFTTKALSAGGVIVIRLGQMHKDIYHQYYAAKLGTRSQIPEPENFLLGYLAPSEDGFNLESIFLDGWDCREQFDAAMAIRGFPTEAYHEIYFLDHYSPDYRKRFVENLIKKHGLPPGVKQKQLLEYRPPSE